MKVPEPRKLNSGKYFIQLRLNGVSVPVTASSAKECKRQAQLIKAEHMAGKALTPRSVNELTLQQAMTQYINKYKNVLSPSTVRSYTIYSKKRFPAYRDRRLADINWQRMIDDELELVSEKTVKNAWGLVSPALKYAKYPVPEVKLTTPPVNEIAFLQPEEIRPFCASVKGRSYEIAALLELHGLRLSEMKALTWDNIDLKREVMTVKGAIVRGLDGEVSKKQNKNITSSRPVPIMIPQLVDALNAVEDKTGHVVSLHGGTLLDDVKRACTRAGITVVTNHGLRHSFASLCYYLKIPERQIQEWGGWKDRATLHKIYIRLAASMQSESKTVFSGFFEENANKNANASQKA